LHPHHNLWPKLNLVEEGRSQRCWEVVALVLCHTGLDAKMGLLEVSGMCLVGPKIDVAEEQR
jgi:hypothetical protein